MKNRTMLIIAMLISSALVAGPVFAWPGACKPNDNRGEQHKEKKESLMRSLGLTPEQDKLLKEAKKSHRAEMEELGKAVKAKMQELQKALAAPGVTRQQVEPIASQIKALQSQMVDRRIDGILKIKSILSPEQYQKLQGMKEEWRKSGHKKQSEKKW